MRNAPVDRAAIEQIEQLQAALANRLVIGQAQGILMERLGLNEEQSFAYLRRLSSSTNVKLVIVAEDLVRTRKLPQLGEKHPS